MRASIACAALGIAGSGRGRHLWPGELSLGDAGEVEEELFFVVSTDDLQPHL
jgi:hypothetical protein